MSPVFLVRVPAKWVLAGEHAVLRGAEAIAFPYPELGLELRFEPGGESFRIVPEEAGDLVHAALAMSREDNQSGAPAPPGVLTIESSIPRGAGLGSSAAFAVAVASWIATLGFAKIDRATLAKKIEDRLHGGTSSGVDVAVVLSGAPIRFRAGNSPTPLALHRIPRFTLHDTGLRAKTDDCIAKVAELRAKQAAEMAAVDAQMGRAGALAVAGLSEFAESGGGSNGRGSRDGALGKVAEAMRLAEDCFVRWGLEPPEATALIRELKARGAVAAKLTGAGGGGMVVALWSG